MLTLKVLREDCRRLGGNLFWLFSSISCTGEIGMKLVGFNPGVFIPSVGGSTGMTFFKTRGGSLGTYVMRLSFVFFLS